ncbi:MAG: DsbA family oxidoreductase [Sandaracinaceae bacterium]|nr:DsbA family oxidoreductase [Sandaracinaceae bacterium]
MTEHLRVDVWSDVVCPFCFIGKRRLEAALAAFAHAARVDVVWRSFELDPSAPREPEEGSLAERLAAKYGTSVREAEARMAHVTDSARADGIEMRLDLARPTGTFDAHRLLHLARASGVGDAMNERLFCAYFTEGARLADHAVLVALAADVGLPPDEVTATLASEGYAREVRADEAEAAALGIRGVPCFVLGGRFAVSGAQPVETFERALERAWSELVEPA